MLGDDTSSPIGCQEKIEQLLKIAQATLPNQLSEERQRIVDEIGRQQLAELGKAIADDAQKESRQTCWELVPKPELPPFEIFPKTYRNILYEMIDYWDNPFAVFATAYASLNATLNGKFYTQIGSNPKQFCNDYVALIGAQGCGKSNPYDILFYPIDIFTKNALTQWEKEEKEREIKRKELEKKNKKKDAVIDIDEILNCEPVPSPPLLIVDDFTIQSIGAELDQKPYISLVSDELLTIFENMKINMTALYDKNRSKAISMPSRFLSLWTGGKPWKTSRKTTKNAIILNCCASIFGTIQPNIFYDTFNQKDVDSGLLARFLLIREPKDGKTSLNRKIFPDEYRVVLSNMTNYFLNIKDVFDANNIYQSRHIKMADDAQIMFDQWHSLKGDEFQVLDRTGLLQKLSMRCERMALIRHLLASYFGETTDDEINIEDVEMAIKFGDWNCKETNIIWDAFQQKKQSNDENNDDKSIILNPSKIDCDIIFAINKLAKAQFTAKEVGEALNKPSVSTKSIGRAIVRANKAFKTDLFKKGDKRIGNTDFWKVADTSKLQQVVDLLKSGS